MKSARLSARGRLTILSTVLVVVSGVALASLTYFLMRRNLDHRLVHIEVTTSGSGGPPPRLQDLVPEIAGRMQAETLTELLTQAAVALAVVTLLATMLGWLVSGRVLRPIRSISSTAQRLSAENMSERVPVDRPPDELAALAGTINGMLDRIQQGVAERDRVLDSQRMFTANAAHELRTPMTTMRTAIDVTLDGEPSRAELLTMAEDIRAAIGQSQRTLDGLLALAHSQASTGKRRRVDLADVTAGIVDGAVEEAAARDVTLRTDLRPAPVRGDPVLLERMAGNLVDNALRYNHAGGDISVTAGTQAECAFLRITNTGRLIAADEAESLLEPFVRGRANRTRADGGAGLGLSIVRAVVVAHGGEISTETRPTGGLEITIRLPRALRL
jgi:signal transduction histidine kinase